MIASLVFVLVSAAAGDLPPPPPPLDGPPDAPITPTPDEDEEADKAPVLKPLRPLESTTPVPDAPPVVTPKKPPTSEDTGLDGFLIGAMQWGVPCVTALVAAPCVLILGQFCPAVWCIPCVLPAMNGYLAAYLGDRFGKNRAPAIWPVLAAYGATIIGTVALGVLFVLSVGQPANVNNPIILAGVGVAMLAAAGGSLLVPVSYALTAEPKLDGDDGSDIPGWFAPNHPTQREQQRRKRERREPVDAPPRLTSMRF